MVSIEEPEENDIAKLTGDDASGTENELETPEEKISIGELDGITFLLLNDLLSKGVLNATLGSSDLSEDTFEDFGGKGAVQANFENLFRDPPPYTTLPEIIQAIVLSEIAKENGYDELQDFGDDPSGTQQNGSADAAQDSITGGGIATNPTNGAFTTNPFPNESACSNGQCQLSVAPPITSFPGAPANGFPTTGSNGFPTTASNGLPSGFPTTASNGFPTTPSTNLPTTPSVNVPSIESIKDTTNPLNSNIRDEVEACTNGSCFQRRASFAENVSGLGLSLIHI